MCASLADLEKELLRLDSIPTDEVRDLLQELRADHSRLRKQNHELKLTCLTLAEQTNEESAGLYENAPFGYLRLSSNGEIRQANSALLDRLGYSASEIAGVPFPKLVVEPNSGELIESYLKLLSHSRQSHQISVHLLSQDGSSFYVQLDGVAVGIRAVENNLMGRELETSEVECRLLITDWVFCESVANTDDIDYSGSRVSDKTENILDKQLIKLAEALPVVIYVRGSLEDKGFSYISQKVKKLTGFDPQSFTGNDSFWLDRIHPMDKTVVLSGTLPAIEPLEQEYRFQNAEGDYIWFRSLSRIVSNENGEFEYVFGVLEDITDRKRSDDTLLRSQAEAEKANRAKSTFLSRMSHELRTPLNAILGFAELQSRYFQEDAPRGLHSSRHHILKAGQHLLSLIEDIFDLIRIEQKNLAIAIERIDVNQVIDESLALVTNQAEKQGISLSYDKTNLFVNANTRRLKQVVVNLLTNAIKYNCEGGVVRIEVTEVEAGQSENKEIEICVMDTGVGIAPLEKEEIFNPFSRLAYAEQSEIEGTGIGLALTKLLVEQMAGSIRCESTRGQGSEFIVRLPDAITEAELFSSSEPKPISSGFAVITMLYIEDDPASKELMQTLLAEYPGMRLLCAGSAEEGIEIAKKLRPDLIVIDINLPRISGVTVMKVLKRDKTFESTRLVALSADAGPTQIETAMKAGFHRYLTKPIELNQLYAELDGFNKAAM
ncbi:MAG: response regulator [Pseudomonadales bacterium]|nr:response regulator [Pseudomonadales bacterium]